MKLLTRKRVIWNFVMVFLFATLLSGCTRAYSSLEDAVRGISAHRDIVTVQNGMESSMVVYSDGHSKYTKTFAAKRNGIYQEVLPQETNLVAHVVFAIGGCTIYQIPETNDYYLIGLCTSTPEGISVEDPLNSVFFTLNTMPEEIISQYNVEKVSYLVCAVLSDVPSDYWIRINGETVKILG